MIPDDEFRYDSEKLRRSKRSIIPKQYIGGVPMNKDNQRSRMCNNMNKKLYEFDYKRLTKRKESTSQAITIDFNTGAFHFLTKELDEITQGDILSHETNLTCTKIIAAHDIKDNFVHRKIELSFNCWNKKCSHLVMIHIYNTKPKILIQGGNNNSKHSCPYIYFNETFKPYMDKLFDTHKDEIMNMNSNLKPTYGISTECPSSNNLDPSIEPNYKETDIDVFIPEASSVKDHSINLDNSLESQRLDNSLNEDYKGEHIENSFGLDTQSTHNNIMKLNVEGLDFPQDPVKILKNISNDHRIQSSSSEEINLVIDRVIENSCANPNDSNDSFNQVDTNNSNKNFESHTNCCSCQKIILKKNRHKLMLSGDKVWNIDITKLCSFTDTAFKSIIRYRPNLMRIGKSEPFVKFVNYWAYMIESLSNKRSSIQHMSGKLIQLFPCLMLQNMSTNNNLNRKILEERIAKWESGSFDEILNETNEIQLNIKKTKKNSSIDKSNKPLISLNNKHRFLSSIKAGDIKASAQSIDPDNQGLNPWSEQVKIELKGKFPKNPELILDLPDNNTSFHSTHIDTKSIFEIIAKARGRSGGISHISYSNLFTMTKMKSCGNTLIQSITKLTNSLANQKLPYLEHFLASRLVPVRKKDGSTRPVCIGDIIRRVCLRSIDLHHKQTVLKIALCK